MSKFKGGQPGNQNARKHGYYSTTISVAQVRNKRSASLVEGIDAEIILLRIKLKSVVDCDPTNVRLITHISKTIAKMLKTRQKLAILDRYLTQKGAKMP